MSQPLEISFGTKANFVGIFNAPRDYPKFYAPFYDIFNFYDGRDEWVKSISEIPEKAVNLFAVHWLHLEVHNGGFWQYFFNSTGTSAPEAIRGFDAIGMDEVSRLVATAADKLGHPFPGTADERRAIVGPPDRRMDFSQFDEKFYDLADTEQFFRKRPKFVAFAEAYAGTG